MHTAFGWLPEGRSPWLDERVRQAYSMSLDRDGWIDAVYNVSRFESEGLPLETAWNTCLGVTFAPYWINPKDAKFGQNAKYFEHNVPEAKKLLAAAGHANGLDFVSTFPEGTSYGAGFPRELEIVGGMTQEAGFRPQASPINYTAEFIPKYREGRGQHEGVAYKIGPGFATDGVARLVYDLYSKAGTNFYGFSASGRNDLSGDPVIESLIQRAKGELDAEKRYAIAHDVQREMAKKQWMVMWPGGASGFLMSWPAVQNFQVYRAGNLAPASRWWLDPTKAPLKA
jgi:ABC-type transport system substrate-binding protein